MEESIQQKRTLFLELSGVKSLVLTVNNYFDILTENLKPVLIREIGNSIESMDALDEEKSDLARELDEIYNHLRLLKNKIEDAIKNLDLPNR